MTAGPYHVVERKRKMSLLNENTNPSSDSVVTSSHTPQPSQSKDKLQRMVRPLTVQELMPNMFPTSESLNFCKLPSAVQVQTTNESEGSPAANQQTPLSRTGSAIHTPEQKVGQKRKNLRNLHGLYHQPGNKRQPGTSICKGWGNHLLCEVERIQS